MCLCARVKFVGYCKVFWFSTLVEIVPECLAV